MRSISIFGLGYVGTVTASCFASRGHKVIGVDRNPSKVDRIQAGMSPIVEAGVQEMIDAAKREGTISATMDATAATRPVACQERVRGYRSFAEAEDLISLDCCSKHGSAVHDRGSGYSGTGGGQWQEGRTGLCRML